MKKAIALLFLSLYTTFSIACSTFLLSKNGHHVFGRNYDWVTGNGVVLVNARGLKKTSFVPPGSKAATWTSRYGSISFNQFGKEFPHGGMNEKGLVVELMWLTETAYPTTDNRAALNELQWIQYQLDNCASIEEVINTDKTIRINRNNAVPLHYLVADAKGNAATIEFINGKTVVHKGNNLTYPVLTNTVYGDAMDKVNISKTYSDNSVQRFATACSMVQQYKHSNKAQPVDYAFSILNKIAQGDYTKWSIVYDITARQVHFITNDHKQRKSFSFSDFDFTCKETSLSFSMDNRKSGKVSAFFTPLKFDQNKELIELSAAESRSQVEIPKEAIAGAAAYFNKVTCN